MPISAERNPYLFSAGTVLAYNIDNEFYGGRHFVWCALSCDSRAQAASSNPLSIARRFIEDIVSLDTHSDKINQNIAGILYGSHILCEKGVINGDTVEKIQGRVAAARWSEFLPLIYVIDTRKVSSRIIEVPSTDAASKTSPEYKLTDLQDGEFELIDIAQLINAAQKVSGRAYRWLK